MLILFVENNMKTECINDGKLSQILSLDVDNPYFYRLIYTSVINLYYTLLYI